MKNISVKSGGIRLGRVFSPERKSQSFMNKFQASFRIITPWIIRTAVLSGATPDFFAQAQQLPQPGQEMRQPPGKNEGRLHGLLPGKRLEEKN